jgi:hypothetical protein
VVVFQIWKWLFSYSMLFPAANREPYLSRSNEQMKLCGLLRGTISLKAVRNVSHLDGSLPYSGK